MKFCFYPCYQTITLKILTGKKFRDKEIFLYNHNINHKKEKKRNTRREINIRVSALFCVSESMPLSSSHPHTWWWHLPMGIWGSVARENGQYKRRMPCRPGMHIPISTSQDRLASPPSSCLILILSPHKLLFCLNQLWSAFSRQ